MSSRRPRVNGWPLVTLLATGSCFTVGPFCGPIVPECPRRSDVCEAFESASIAQTTPPFEGECPSATCAASAERGSVSSASSVHPAERAIAIDADTIAAVRVPTFEPADGARLTGLARCEAGGSLAFLGDQRTPLRTPLGAVEHWTAFRVQIRTPTRNFLTIGAATSASTVATLRFENAGSSRCLVARLEFETLANLCSRYACIGDASAPDAQPARQDADVDVPWPIDVADANNAYDAHDAHDAQSADALDDDADERDASDDVTDRDASFDATDDAVETDTRESPDSADGV